MDLHSVKIREENLTWNEEKIQSKIFFDSLITNVKEKQGFHYRTKCENTTSTRRSSPVKLVRSHSNALCKQPSTNWNYCESPFPEIDQILANMVHPGCIRRWRIINGDSIHFDIIGNRWCANVGREHKSNNIFWICNLGKGVLMQGCYDPDCKGFLGDEVKLPDNAMPWTKMEEWDEEVLINDELFDENENQMLLNASLDY